MSGDGKPAIRTEHGPGGEVYVISNPSSVEVSKNAKGDITFAVKVYDADPDVAAEKAEKLIERLRKTYAAPTT